MGLAVDARRGLPVGRLDQAEDLAGRLVDPIVLVVDALLGLDAEIRLVRADDIGGLHSGDVMHVHVRGHGFSFW